MKRTLLTALALALMVPGMLQAQTTDGGTIAVDINELLFVDIVVGDNQTLTPNLTDFDAGFVDASALTVDSRGNTPYNLFVRGNSANWSYNPDGSGNTDPAKPVGDLNFKLASAGSYTAMTTANQLVEGFANPSTNSSAVDLQVDLSYVNDVEGVYTMNYTVEVLPN